MHLVETCHIGGIVDGYGGILNRSSRTVETDDGIVGGSHFCDFFRIEFVNRSLNVSGSDVSSRSIGNLRSGDSGKRGAVPVRGEVIRSRHCG